VQFLTKSAVLNEFVQLQKHFVQLKKRFEMFIVIRLGIIYHGEDGKGEKGCAVLKMPLEKPCLILQE